MNKISCLSRLSGGKVKVRLYTISNTPARRQLLEKRISSAHQHVEILDALKVPHTANDAEKMQYTLAELLLLSKMQHMIITSKSTFGMVAQGLARRGAWIVRQGAENEQHGLKSDSCEHEPSSEPEYQMMGSLAQGDSCAQQGAFIPMEGERTVL